MPDTPKAGEKIFRGIPVSTGVCRGKIVILRRFRPVIDLRKITEAELGEEVGRLERALVQTRHQILDVQRRCEWCHGRRGGQHF